MPTGRALIAWISSKMDNEDVLDELATICKASANPFAELTVSGKLYFQDVPSDKRFFNEVDGEIFTGAQYNARTMLMALRGSTPSPTLEPRSDDEEPVELTRESLHDNQSRQSLVRSLQNNVVADAHRFRPYAIAFALGSCLWPKTEHRVAKEAILTNAELVRQWTTGHTESFEMSFEKARYLEKAYEIYFETRTHDTSVPTVEPDILQPLSSNDPVGSISGRDLLEKFKKYFAYEDTLIKVFKSQMRVLRESHNFETAAEVHDYFNDFFRRSIVSLDTLKNEFKAKMKLVVDKQRKAEIEQVRDELIQRQVIYLAEASRHLMAGTPRPLPSPSPASSPTPETFGIRIMIDIPKLVPMNTISRESTSSDVTTNSDDLADVPSQSSGTSPDSLTDSPIGTPASELMIPSWSSNKLAIPARPMSFDEVD